MVYVDSDYNVIRGVTPMPKGDTFATQHIDTTKPQQRTQNTHDGGQNGETQTRNDAAEQTRKSTQPVIDDLSTSFDDDTPLDFSEIDEYGY